MSFPFDLHSAAVSDSHLPSHAHAMLLPCLLLKATARPSRDGRAVLWHGMASVNQTRPLCVNQMATTHSKPLAARHDRGTAWAWHAMCESAFIVPPAWTHMNTDCGQTTDEQQGNVRPHMNTDCGLTTDEQQGNVPMTNTDMRSRNH